MFKRPEGPCADGHNAVTMCSIHRKPLLTGFFLFCVTFSLFGQYDWVSKNEGFNGGEVKTLWSEGDLVLAGTERAGIFRSTNGGESWTISNQGLAHKSINQFLATGDSIFVATHFSGIFFSTNAGQTWAGIGSGLTNIQVTAMEKSGTYMYAGTVDGLFRSSDVGKTWESKSEGLPAGTTPYRYAQISFIQAHKNKVFAGTAYNGLYSSSNNGTTWEPVPSIPADMSVSAIIEKDGLLLVGTYNFGVYTSADDGNTWIRMENTMPNEAITGFAVMNNRIYASTYSGVFVSDNNGSVWTYVTTMQGPQPSVRCIVRTSRGLLIGSRYSGVQKSSDGVTWTNASTGITALIANQLVKHNDQLYAATFNGLYKTNLDNVSWTPTPFAFDVIRMYEMVSIGDSIVASTSSQMLVSTDEGSSWEFVATHGIPYGQQIKLSHNKNLYVHTQNGLYQLRHGKVDWEVAIAQTDFEYHHIMRASGDTLVSATWNGRIYVSLDDGKTWALRKSGLPEYFAVHGLTFHKSFIFVSMNEGVYRSADAGNTWQQASTPTQGSSVMALHGHEDLLFAGTFSGVYASRDLGKSWIPVNDTRMEQLAVQSFTVQGDDLYAGTTEGIYALPLAAFAPQFISFTPTVAVTGDAITITGKNFTPDLMANTINVNGVSAQVLLASASVVAFKVPAGATSGPITLTTSGMTLESPEPLCLKVPGLAITGSAVENGFLLTSTEASGNQWYYNDQPQIGATQKTFLATEPGVYSVRVADAVCFTEASYTVLVTSVSDSEGASLIYPVPARQTLTVNLQRFEDHSPVEIEVINAEGIQVKSMSVDQVMETTIDTRELESGIYILCIRQGLTRVTQRFSKVH